MAYSDIQELYTYYEENPDPARADIHKKLKSFVYKGNNAYIQDIKWKDDTGKIILYEFDDGISKVQRRIYDTGEGNPSVTTRIPYVRAFGFYQAYNYAGHVRYNCYVGFTNTIRDASLKTDVVRIENGTTTVLSEHTYTFLGSTQSIDIGYGGDLTEIMGHAVTDNSLTLTGCVPFYDGKFAEYKLKDVGWSGSYPQSLSNFDYLLQAQQRFNGAIKNAIEDYLLELVQYDMSPLFVDGFIEPIEDSDETGKTYFYDCYTYETDFGETYKDLLNHKWGEIKVPSGCRVWGVVNDNTPYNIKLHVTKGYSFLAAIQNDGTFIEVTSIDVDITTRKTVTDGNGNYYWGALSTNIPIFNNDTDGQRYSETGDDGATIYDDVWNGSTNHHFGELVVKNNANSYSVSNPFTTVYNVSGVINNLHSWLFNINTQSLFNDVVLWGNNPIDMVIDYYWTPIDIETFGYDNKSSLYEAIYFGGIEAGRDGTEHYTKIAPTGAYWEVMGSEQTLFDIVMDRIYNDWRDYELFTYKLYLPFYGLVDLPSAVITGKPLKLTCNYFIHTHVLKYYLYIDNVINSEYEVIIGVNLPLMATDAVGRAKENLDGIMQQTMGAISSADSIASGNVAGSVSGISNLANGIIKTKRGESLVNWGSASCSGNIGDYTVPIMIVEEQQHYAPVELHSMYNYPSYYIGKLSTCSGYCEVSDVRLTGMGSYSDQEKEQLKAILKGGVIL